MTGAPRSRTAGRAPTCCCHRRRRRRRHGRGARRRRIRCHLRGRRPLSSWPSRRRRLAMAEASCWRCTSTDAPPRRSSRAAAAPCAAATVTRASRARSVPSAGRRWSMVVSSGTWLSADTACTARAGREGLVASKERRMAEADTRAARCRHHRRRDRFRVQAGRLTAAWWCGVRRPCTSVAAMLPVGTRSARDGRRQAAAAHGARRAS